MKPADNTIRIGAGAPAEAAARFYHTIRTSVLVLDARLLFADHAFDAVFACRVYERIP